MNSLPPAIHHLPTDALCEIFEVWADIDPPAPNRLGFILGSHVCHSWRSIMLDLSALWAGIICTYRDASVVQTFLTRARDAPLVLNFAGEPNFNLLEALRTQNAWSRARHIDMPYPGTVDIDWLLSYHRALPKLRHLNIGERVPINRSAYKARSDCTLSAPALSRLVVERTGLIIEAPGLRDLDLRLTHRDTSSIMDLSVLLRTISMYPMLHRLSLLIGGGATGVMTESEVPPILHGPIALRQLQTLQLAGKPGSLAMIWKNLDIPQRLSLSCFMAWDPEPSDFLESVRAFLQASEHRALCLSAERRSVGTSIYYQIACFTSDSAEDRLKPGMDTCTYQIGLTSRAFVAPVSLELLRAVAAVKRGVTSLTLHTDFGEDELWLMNMDLEALANVENLHLQCKEATESLRILLVPGSLPVLKVVNIDMENNDDWRGVINVLRMRVNASGRLKNLVLKGAIMYWDEAERREESMLLQGLAEELHDERVVIWKDSVDVQVYHRRRLGRGPEEYLRW
ncbi:unnamed protein product [Peniophora sp. CBMAI 1063]|nr:unnamed protein product [Peniophora sp. CBMAI 1063]